VLERCLSVSRPPGAGKSTVARLLAGPSAVAAWADPPATSEDAPPGDDGRSALVEGDAFFGFLARGAVAPWLPGSHEQNEIVTRAAATTAGRFAAEGYDTVFDGMVGPWFLPTFAEATGLDRLDYVVLLPSCDTCVDRVRSRPGHGFRDEAATRKMHDSFVAATVDPRHVLVDPPGAPEVVADLVAAARAAGRLTVGR
jgi:hypothetical protein